MLVVKSAAAATSVEKWVTYQGDIKVLLRGIDDKQFQIGLERARRLVLKSDAQQSLSSLSATDGDETEIGVQAQLAGRYLVRGWNEAVKDEAGEPAPFSHQACIDLLKDNLGFLAWVITESSKIAYAQKEDQVETVGKSLPATDGKLSEID